MQTKKSAPVDSVGIFLREVARKGSRSQSLSEQDEAAEVVLGQLAREGHDLDIESLHEKMRELSFTRLNRTVARLEEAGLVVVDPDTDAVSLSDRGRTAASLHVEPGHTDE